MTRPYPRYRDSGVAWLGEVPSHWEVKRLKLVASTNDDTLSEAEDPLRPLAYVDIGSVDSTAGIVDMEEMVFEDAPSRARRLVCDGDTIVSTVRTYLRAIAPVAAPPPEMVVSTGFAVIRPRTLAPGFASWALREHRIVEEIVARSTGVSYPAINASEIGDLLLPLPPLDEQRAIAAFLDRETERVDALVAKKRSLLERLAEYRTALITRTVTKGLDPSVAMKDSGVEWLGEVPSHWDVARLLRVMQLKAGDSITSEQIDDVGEYPVFGGNGVRGFTDRHTHEGDFVLIGRQGALCGNINLARGKFWASEHAVVADALEAASVSWLARVLAAMKLNQYSAAAAQPGLALDRIKGLHVPRPPLDEQRAIAAFLDDETARIDGLSSQVETAIERLLEYRTALVTAAVTGKIDVRESTREYAAAK